MYPFYLVIFTSVVGIRLTRHLEKERLIGRLECLVCYSVFISKLIMLVSQFNDITLAFFIYLFTVLFPHFFHLESEKLSKTLLIIYAVLFLVVSPITMIPTVSNLFYFSLLKYPDYLTNVGVFLVCWSAAVSALLIKKYPENIQLKRIFSAVTLIGFFTILMFPEFGIFNSFSRGENNSPVLIGMIIATLFCFNSRFLPVRLVYFALFSTCSSVLLIHSISLPFNWGYFTVFTLIFANFISLINLLYYNTRKSLEFVRYLFCTYIVLLPLSLFLVYLISKSAHPSLRLSNEYFRVIKNTLLGLYATSPILLSLLFNLKLNKFKYSSAKSSFDESFKFFPEIANGFTLLSFFTSIYFCYFILDSPEFIYYFLPAILILINQVQYFFSLFQPSSLPCVAIFLSSPLLPLIPLIFNKNTSD